MLNEDITKKNRTIEKRFPSAFDMDALEFSAISSGVDRIPHFLKLSRVFSSSSPLSPSE